MLQEAINRYYDNIQQHVVWNDNNNNSELGWGINHEVNYGIRGSVTTPPPAIVRAQVLADLRTAASPILSISNPMSHNHVDRSAVSRINTRSIDTVKSDSKEEEDDDIVLVEEHYDDNCQILSFDDDGVVDDDCLEAEADGEPFANEESQGSIWDNLT